MCTDNEFEDIRPYSDEETVEAMGRAASHPMLPVISRYLFPNEDPSYLSSCLLKVKDVDNFQQEVMFGVVSSIIARTSEGFSFSGQEYLTEGGGRFVAVTNHRDIVLDPALFLYTMFDAGITGCELCVGSNLIQTKFIEDMMRSNRMIKVIRGVSARDLYFSSQKLSKYIRNKVTSGDGSVWIAQREGRTKDGMDRTEQGILKMLDMSGSGSFVENFKELNIIPVSISYEYEPCDARKARELLIKKTEGTYTKKPGEDTHSILTGIRQRKGHIHLSIGKPLTEEELRHAAELDRNNRYQTLMQILDERITSGYRLWKTNYMGYDLLGGTSDFLGVKYLPEDLELFRAYVDHKLGKIESRLDKGDLTRIFLGIYANPVIRSL